MANYVYETHSMADPILPFIFHSRFVVTRRNSLPNWHENIELLYCTGGKGYVQCGSERTDFLPGDIFVVNANTPHSICSEGSVLYQCLIVDDSFCAANGIPMESLHFQSHIRDEGLRCRFELVGEAFAGYDSERLCAAAEIRHGVLGLLLTLCEGYRTEKPAQAVVSANERVKKAAAYIRKNLSRPLTLAEIADHVGVSKYHLSREFKAFSGCTIIQTTNLIRCTEAKGLIESGMSVSAAAAACGFENLSYFTRTFKKYFRSLPSAYLPGTGAAPVLSATDEDVCY